MSSGKIPVIENGCGFFTSRGKGLEEFTFRFDRIFSAYPNFSVIYPTGLESTANDAIFLARTNRVVQDRLRTGKYHLHPNIKKFGYFASHELALQIMKDVTMRNFSIQRNILQSVWESDRFTFDQEPHLGHSKKGFWTVFIIVLSIFIGLLAVAGVIFACTKLCQDNSPYDRL